MGFTKDSWNAHVPNGYLDLPEVCKNADTCSLLSTCTAVRLGVAGLIFD